MTLEEINKINEGLKDDDNILVKADGNYSVLASKNNFQPVGDDGGMCVCKCATMSFIMPISSIEQYEKIEY